MRVYFANFGSSSLEHTTHHAVRGVVQRTLSQNVVESQTVSPSLGGKPFPPKLPPDVEGWPHY